MIVISAIRISGALPAGHSDGERLWATARLLPAAGIRRGAVGFALRFPVLAGVGLAAARLPIGRVRVAIKFRVS